MVTTIRKHSIKNKFFYFIDKNWIIVFLLILFLSIVVRIYGLERSSIWHDEGFSVMLSSNGLKEIWLLSAKDVHPPFYYLLLSIWRAFFGDSVFALRSLSLLSGVVVVALGYIVALKISNKRLVAALAGLFLALNPFLVRYSQEARMYSLQGMFLLFCVLGLIYIIQKRNSWFGYLLYGLGLITSIYTHYFSFLAIGGLWLYVIYASLKKPLGVRLLFDWKWWATNTLSLIVFLPWLPNMIQQLNRGQGLGWLSKTDLSSLNETIWQFYSFSSGNGLWVLLFWIVPIALILYIIIYSLKDKSKYRLPLMLFCFSFTGLFVAIIASFIRPVFHERYFIFSAIGISILLSLAIANTYKYKKVFAVLIVVTLLVVNAFGVYGISKQNNHQISKVMSLVNQNYKPGDTLLAGELYVYFDADYYKASPDKIYLYTGEGRPNGFGESSLIQNDNVYIDSYAQIDSNRAWLIGKTGDKQYYESVPNSWELLDKFQSGYSEVRLYQIK